MTDRLTAMLTGLNKAELRNLADAAGLSLGSRATKADLIEALSDHLRTDEPTDAPEPHGPPRCSQRTGGHPCGLPAADETDRCGLHGGFDVVDLARPVAGRLGFDTWPALIRQLALASYDTDPLGLDPVISDMFWRLLSFLYLDYFRVNVEGAHHIPESGPGVLVGNHAGAALPYDGAMLAMAVAHEAPVGRRVRLIGTEIFNMLPFVSHLYRKTGAAYASREDARWILGEGHLLGVFPEGVAGFQKSQDQAYKTQRFGRGGFVELAMHSGAPIIPVAIVGGEEVHPVLFTSKRLAQLVRLVFPEQRVEQMAVWLNPIPLPVKWHVRFLEPIDVGPARTTIDRLAVLEMAEHVREQIQAALDDMLEHRQGIF
ncbi:MAG: 1-acyl-sn-glycerol-3-phosphate acyltransferase [Acidimicrobiia bacterium]|nr:1-acyl-sn-glycerol-3-phosphate acyltransferase [Acidimicrobiia bacterium]